MKLKYQRKIKKCPLFTHEGVFEATDEMLIRFQHDLNRCAKCTAYENPALPSFQEDLLQIARVTLWTKGPLFDPNHETKASFRTYILPWICGALTKAKKNEVQHYQHFISPSDEVDFPYEGSETQETPQQRLLSDVLPSETDFVDRLIWEMWNADFKKALPQLLQCLTKREEQVLTLIQMDMKQCDIAETLTLSKPRINQLLRQIEAKLSRESKNLGLIE